MTQQPEIEYPCSWSYRVIGPSETALREAVGQIMGDHPYELEVGRSSSEGRFLSCKLTTIVRDEAQRQAIFSALGEHEATRYVL